MDPIMLKGFIAFVVLVIYSFVILMSMFGEDLTWKKYLTRWIAPPAFFAALYGVIFGLGHLVNLVF